MPRNIIDALGAFTASTGKEVEAPAGRGTRTNLPVPVEQDPFSVRVESLLSRSAETAAPLVGGTVELVGLDDVRRALGKTWSQVAAQVGELAETEVRNNLGADDFYRAYGTSSFLICFVGLPKAVAEKRAQYIAARIKTRLAHLYPNVAHEITPEPFVALLDRDMFTGAGQPLVERLVQHLVKLRQELERSVGRFRSPLLRRSKLLFAPAWHAAKRVTAFNRCILDSWAREGIRESYRARVGGPEYQQLLAELDYITLTRSLRALYMMLKTGRAVPLLIPVSYQTIRGVQSGPSYRRLLETMKPAHKSLLAIEIVDLPEQEKAESVLEHVSALAPLVKWLALLVDLDDSRTSELACEPLWALAVDLEGRKSTEPVLQGQLRRLRALTAESQLNTLVHGANSVGLALTAIDTGMNYIDGPAIHPAGLEPRTPAPLNPVLATLPQHRVNRYRH